MQDLSTLSLVSLYLLLVIIGLYSLIVLVWQIRVLKGTAMKNADGSVDSWHEQKTHYGIAIADITIACPINLAGITLVFIAPRWGFYLLALASFWWVWANTMTTATSLHFEKPRLTLNWFLTFPFGIVVGLAYIVWTVVHFDAIFV
jgi:hypothetical protein